MTSNKDPTALFILLTHCYSTNNCKKEEMACDLEPQCNFLYGFFTCNLPDDAIHVEVTVVF